jgi:hypothetical protein
LGLQLECRAFCKSEENVAHKGPAQPLPAKLCSRVGRGFQDKMFKLYTGQSLHEVCPTLTNELAHKSLGGFPQCHVLHVWSHSAAVAGWGKGELTKEGR